MTREERNKIIKQKQHQQCDDCFKFLIRACWGIQYTPLGYDCQLCPEGQKIYDSIPKADN